MKLNKKKLNIVLSQIKAHLNVAMLADNPEFPGSVDFFFQPKAQDVDTGYLNRLTCSMHGDDGLFGNDTAETLGKPLAINIARLRDALKNGDFDPEIEDGVVNGIDVLAGPDDSEAARMGAIIDSARKTLRDRQLPESVEFVMPRIDYELMAKTMTPFVSQDPIRYFMRGYYVDLGKSGDYINFCATDGRRLSLCKFPCSHPKLGDGKGKGGGVILRPLNLFIPGSAYSRTRWTVNEYFSRIRIRTEDYDIDCWGQPIEGDFPNYPKVIPGKSDLPEWISLSAKSARNAFSLIKGRIDNSGYSSSKNMVFFNAKDPKRIQLAVPGASVDIDGEASRPMRLWASWDLMNSGFIDTPYTKFMLQNVNKAILIEEPRAVPGTAMSITKVIMPAQSDEDVDEWGIAGTAKVQSARDVAVAAENTTEYELEDEDDDEADDCAAISYGDSEEEDKIF
jgi:hypothetical protein